MNAKARILLLFFVQLVVSTGMSAQFDQKADLGVKSGEPYETYNKFPGELIYSEEGIFSIKVKFKKVYFQRFDLETLEEVVSGELEFGEVALFEGAFYKQGELYVLFSTGIKKGKEELYYGRVDINVGQWKSEPKLLFNTSDKILGSNGKAKKNVLPPDKFKVITSEDESKVAVMYILKKEVKKDGGEYSVYGFAVFGKEMRLLWQDEFLLPVADEKSGVYNRHVDNSGVVRLMTMDVESVPSKPTQSRLCTKIYKKTAASPLREEAAISVDPFRYIYDMAGVENPDGGMIYAGYCTDHEKNNAAQAIFFSRADKDGMPIAEKTTPISLALQNQHQSEEALKEFMTRENKEEGGYWNQPIEKLVLMEDGGVTLISHRLITYEDLQNFTRYYSGYEILVTRMDKDGHVLWMKKLPKKQDSDLRDDLTFFYTYYEGDHYFYYLDVAENLNLKAGESLKKYSNRGLRLAKGHLVASIIKDESGAAQLVDVMDLKSVNGNNLNTVFPVKMIESPKGEVFLEGNMGIKNDVMIKITPNRY